MSGVTPLGHGRYRMPDGREFGLEDVVAVEVLTTSPDADKASLLAQAAERLARCDGATYTPVAAMGSTLGADGLWRWTVKCTRPARPTTKATEAP